MRVGEKNIQKKRSLGQTEATKCSGNHPAGKRVTKCSGNHPAGKDLHKSPRGNIVCPILQFFIRVTRFSGFGQVKITGKSRFEIDEIRGRRENMFCVRIIMPAELCDREEYHTGLLFTYLVTIDILDGV